ncbi:MAG: ANTAR domain-containing protein, partial [Oscillospiraceae bacterium]|nr:ANTAR domain-containing protein [Oscillospiraceae bacterium]
KGIFTLLKPTSTQIITQALEWMAAARERLRRLESKATSIEEKMEEIRLVNRAKWLLIENLKMTESDAHHYIEKQAMDRCCSKKEISLSIIKTYS